jgi:hypothetical protein
VREWGRYSPYPCPSLSHGAAPTHPLFLDHPRSLLHRRGAITALPTRPSLRIRHRIARRRPSPVCSTEAPAILFGSERAVVVDEEYAVECAVEVWAAAAGARGGAVPPSYCGGRRGEVCSGGGGRRTSCVWTWRRRVDVEVLVEGEYAVGYACAGARGNTSTGVPVRVRRGRGWRSSRSHSISGRGRVSTCRPSSSLPSRRRCLRYRGRRDRSVDVEESTGRVLCVQASCLRVVGVFCFCLSTSPHLHFPIIVRQTRQFLVDYIGHSCTITVRSFPKNKPIFLARQLLDVSVKGTASRCRLVPPRRITFPCAVQYSLIGRYVKLVVAENTPSFDFPHDFS